jgi:hypothetical protein
MTTHTKLDQELLCSLGLSTDSANIVMAEIEAFRADVRKRDAQAEGLKNTLRAVLLFYKVGPWDFEARQQWALLMGPNGGRTECSTKALCERIREVLPENRVAFGAIPVITK